LKDYILGLNTNLISIFVNNEWVC